MRYRVEFTARAERDLAYLFDEKHAANSEAAFRWFNRLETAIATLSTNPRRSPLAPESKKAGRALHHLLYGNKRNVYRVIFEIDNPAMIVWVITIRHGAMEPACLDE